MDPFRTNTNFWVEVWPNIRIWEFLPRLRPDDVRVSGRLVKILFMAVSRRGARTPDLVPAEVRSMLERGGESANHMEQIAMDMAALFAYEFPELSGRASGLKAGGLVHKMRLGGAILWKELGESGWEVAATSASDSVRGWGAMAVGACPDLTLHERFASIRPFAADPHFAVREWAWLAVRPQVCADPRGSLSLLEPWTHLGDPNLRRFASEVTRPRGVWSSHIPLLKAEPWLAAELLGELRADSSRYVQNSVGNWLNDASKTRADWVAAICDAWLARAPEPATIRICARGRRSVPLARPSQP
jgi:3-methyladenine DNA glycosylase AlkC